MLRESVSQLAGIRSQIHIDLLHLLNHLLSRTIICAKLSICQISPLVVTADYAPKDEIRNILCDGSGEGGKDVGSVSNLRRIASDIERENSRGVNDL